MLDSAHQSQYMTQQVNELGPCQVSCASMILPAWHCIYTFPSKEGAADRALKRAGFETYFPQFLMTWRDRQKKIRPLFPRYTFVRFDENVDAYSLVIRDSCGQEVGRLMTEPTTKRPYTIPTSVVDTLLAQAAPDGVIYPPQPRIMQRGDTGKVNGGPLDGFAGICSRTSRDRVWLLLEILGRRSEVQFDRSSVEFV